LYLQQFPDTFSYRERINRSVCYVCGLSRNVSVVEFFVISWVYEWLSTSLRNTRQRCLTNCPQISSHSQSTHHCIVVRGVSNTLTKLGPTKNVVA